MKKWLSLLALVPSLSWAGTPGTIAVNGTLRLNSGTSTVITGTRDLDLKLYDAATGGTMLWSQSFTGVNVNQGRFQVLLGPTGTVGGALSSVLAQSSPPTHIEIIVTPPNGTAETMTPRLPLASTAYAIHAKVADSLAAGATVSIAPNSITSAMLMPGAVTSTHLAPASVNLASSAVTGSITPQQGGVPIGTVIQHVASTPPTGYLPMNGGVYSSTSYSALNALLNPAAHLAQIAQGSITGVLAGVSLSTLTNSNNVFVAPLYSPYTAAISTDSGASWTAATTQSVYPSFVLVAGSNLMLVNGSGSYSYSTDQGATWSVDNATVATAGTSTSLGFVHNNIFYTAGSVYNSGSYEVFIQSYAGSPSWNYKPVFTDPSYVNISGVLTRGNSGTPIILLTGKGLRITTDLGTTWTPYDATTDYSYGAYSGSTYCATGSTSTATSSSGTTWTSNSQVLTGVSWMIGGNNYFVAGRVSTSYPQRTEIMASTDCLNWVRVLEAPGNIKGFFVSSSNNFVLLDTYNSKRWTLTQDPSNFMLSPLPQTNGLNNYIRAQ